MSSPHTLKRITQGLSPGRQDQGGPSWRVPPFSPEGGNPPFYFSGSPKALAPGRKEEREECALTVCGLLSWILYIHPIMWYHLNPARVLFPWNRRGN